MLNEFIQVTDVNTEEKYLINLSDISYIRELSVKNNSFIRLKSKEKLTIHVKQSFESFEEFFEELKD